MRGTGATYKRNQNLGLLDLQPKLMLWARRRRIKTSKMLFTSSQRNERMLLRDEHTIIQNPVKLNNGSCTVGVATLLKNESHALAEWIEYYLAEVSSFLCIYIHVHTYIMHTYICTSMHTYIHERRVLLPHAHNDLSNPHINTHTYTHTYIHTYIHSITYIHTYRACAQYFYVVNNDLSNTTHRATEVPQNHTIIRRRRTHDSLPCRPTELKLVSRIRD
jgi:hypothetical protein